MRRTIARGLFSMTLALLLGAAVAGRAGADEPQLAHMVFFTLKDHSKSSRDAFVATCKKYLSDHPGTAYFSVGVIAEDVVEPVSDRDFDVALHLVFDNKAAKEKYLKDPRHDSFVAENKDVWSRVRVFDSYLVPPKR